TEKKVVDNVSFNVHRGEIVGCSGLQGAGRTELAMSVFGRSYGSNISGSLKIDGKPMEFKNVREAIGAGLAYVTEDRKGNGLILAESIAKNTTMARLEKVCSNGIINIDKENQVAEEYKGKMRTKAPTVQQAVGNLSGGNQQKVLLSKWMFADPEVLILDEPTRGIDVGAKYEIYCIMNDLVAQGKSVVMISSEMPELLGMCDRIYVMNEGRMVAEMPASEATQEKIMSAILQSDKKDSTDESKSLNADKN
ncbi:MAG: sugar ABC transporter ATP-binding protein, partial [Oscillospiraceae bacterium]|nr:sugar ABC transporter ATP-binding protein [Oscillospiraceae bacterium]